MINYYLNESVSDEEILDKLPDEKVEQIEDLLKKVTKKSVDLEKIAQKDDPKKGSEEKGDEKDSKGSKEEDEGKNEAVGTVATIAVATIVPLILEAGGNFANLINRTLGLKFTKQEFKQYRFLKKVLSAYKELLRREFGDLHYGGKTFRYSWKGGGGGSGEKWTELGKKADEELKNMGWSGDPQIYYKSGLKKDLTKKESLHRFGHLVKFESYLNEEFNPFGLFGKKNKKDKSQPEKSPVEDKEKDKKDWKEAQKLFGDDHKHGSETYDSNWEPSYSKEDSEFVKNEIDRIEELMKTNLPIETTIGNKLKTTGHKLHAAYTYPIRLFLKGIAWYYNWKWMKNKENRTIAANVIYAFAMLLFTGMLIWDKLSHLHGVSSYSEMILKNYKSGVSIEEFVNGLVVIWKGKD